jgi:protein-tyrosine phosphatase
MNNGISFFNCFWKDLTNPTFEQLLNIVQVMDFTIKQGGKVLVHCHAGQGRTATLIGAYLMYVGVAKDEYDAIAITKRGRQKCFSKSYNRKFMRCFYESLCQLR